MDVGPFFVAWSHSLLFKTYFPWKCFWKYVFGNMFLEKCFGKCFSKIEMKLWREMSQTQFVVSDVVVVRQKIEIFKPLLANVPFSYSLKTWESYTVFYVFRGCEMGTLTRNELTCRNVLVIWHHFYVMSA